MVHAFANVSVVRGQAAFGSSEITPLERPLLCSSRDDLAHGGPAPSAGWESMRKAKRGQDALENEHQKQGTKGARPLTMTRERSAKPGI